MMNKNYVPLIVMMVIAATASLLAPFIQPLAATRLDKFHYLPLQVSGYQLEKPSEHKPPAWLWPAKGFGRLIQYQHVDTALRQGDFWYYDWTARCQDRHQVPIISMDFTPTLWQCNDGRPLLLLNEPEQINLTPEEVAWRIALTDVEWRGEVYCCGTLAHELGYLAAIVATYEAEFGPWPVDHLGWAVHVYSNRAVWTPTINDPTLVPRAIQDVDALRQYLVDHKLYGRGIIITEYGVLSAHGPTLGWHWPLDLVGAFNAYQRELKMHPYVKTAAWFSSYYPPLNASDLLWSDGRLTELGQLWLRLP
jgi:hypothetical protein